MALFGKKKDKTIDLTNRMMRQHERVSNLRENMKSARPGQSPQSQQVPETSPSENGFSLFDNVASNSYNQPQSYGTSDYVASRTEDAEDRRKKLAKRLMDITDKLEEISNQIYHLQQRVEVLEKKFGQGGFGH